MKRQAPDIFHAQIEKLAYEFWEERGRPLGSSEEDWFRAEQRFYECYHWLGRKAEANWHVSKRSVGMRSAFVIDN
jgi:Protein of unknown function (DUF2934)